MKRFNYTLNHKEDENYMAKMCHEGWATVSLVEGLWMFEPCEPDQFVYRVCYLRGKSKEEIDAQKRELATQGIEFVSQYTFWAIFRSTKEFQLYKPEEEKEICRRMRRPMIPGAIVSWLVCLISIVLALKVSRWILIMTVLTGMYAVICTGLSISYTKLLKTLK